jgi:hypothetical protein
MVTVMVTVMEPVMEPVRGLRLWRARRIHRATVAR